MNEQHHFWNKQQTFEDARLLFWILILFLVIMVRVSHFVLILVQFLFWWFYANLCFFWFIQCYLKFHCLSFRRFSYGRLAQIKFLLPEATQIHKIMLHDKLEITMQEVWYDCFASRYDIFPSISFLDAWVFKWTDSCGIVN
jgi:hypothetical protein